MLSRGAKDEGLWGDRSKSRKWGLEDGANGSSCLGEWLGLRRVVGFSGSCFSDLIGFLPLTCLNFDSICSRSRPGEIDGEGDILLQI